MLGEQAKLDAFAPRTQDGLLFGSGPARRTDMQGSPLTEPFLLLRTSHMGSIMALGCTLPDAPVRDLSSANLEEIDQQQRKRHGCISNDFAREQLADYPPDYRKNRFCSLERLLPAMRIKGQHRPKAEAELDLRSRL